jgi:hypothetical protein
VIGGLVGVSWIFIIKLWLGAEEAAMIRYYHNFIFVRLDEYNKERSKKGLKPLTTT